MWPFFMRSHCFYAQSPLCQLIAIIGLQLSAFGQNQPLNPSCKCAPFMTCRDVTLQHSSRGGEVLAQGAGLPPCAVGLGAYAAG
jgi:hypothetical protein